MWLTTHTSSQLATAYSNATLKTLRRLSSENRDMPIILAEQALPAIQAGADPGQDQANDECTGNRYRNVQ